MQTEPPNADPPNRKRRWFQLSLRSLMVLMLLAGIGMTWLVALKNRAERQKIAVEIILKDGGAVVYDYQDQTLSRGATSHSANATPPGPVWLRGLLGDDFFVNVVGARIVTDAGLAHLTELSTLERLRLQRRPESSCPRPAARISCSGSSRRRIMRPWNPSSPVPPRPNAKLRSGPRSMTAYQPPASSRDEPSRGGTFEYDGGMSKPAIYKAAGILCLFVFAIGVIVSFFLPVADTWLRRTMWSILEASPLIVAIWFFQLARQLNRHTDSRD